MNKKLSFAIENVEQIDEESDSQFATAKIRAFNTGRSLHDTLCDEETLKKTAPTIYEKPIVFEYNKGLGDFGTHSSNPIVSGFIVPNTATFESLADGRICLNVYAKIWKKYCQKFLDIFDNSKDKTRSVSVEMEITDYEELPSGLIKLLDFKYAAVCVLGTFVNPASPGSNLEMMTFAKDENREYQKIYEKEFSKYDVFDLKIPEKVRDNARKGLELYHKSGKGGSPTSLATARYIIKNDFASPEKIRHIYSYFVKNQEKDFSNKESDNSIMWTLWGGDEGYRWSKALNDAMDEKDRNKPSYFSEDDFYEKSDLENLEKNNSKEELSMGDKIEDEFTEDKKDVGMSVDSKDEVKEDMAVEDVSEMALDTKEDENKEVKAEEDKESSKEQDEEKKDGVEKKFSLDAYLDVATVLAMLVNETKEYQIMVDQCMSDDVMFEDKAGMIMSAMYAKMCKMAEDAKTHESYMAETADYAELKKFKADQDAAQMNYNIDMTLKNVEDTLSSDEMSAAREDSKNFSVENLDGWKNKVLALAFSKSKKNIQKDDLGVKKYSVVDNNTKKTTKTTDSPWPVLQ